MDPKELCLKLAQADSEKEVEKALRQAGYWDDPKVWRLFGDNENNYSSIGNQQSSAETALVEKLINSVDALLMAEAIRKGVNITGPCAPQSIRDALVSLFRIRDGKLSNVPAKERSLLAENISMVATGAKSSPCYSVIDKGEGQMPDKMPETLLSLSKSNKLRIPFVQGKFNMGGTGVLRFCGRHNFQLIISRRHLEISKLEGNQSPQWGFTIVRREEPKANARSSEYRYLAPENKILRFSADSLKLLPGEYPHAYGKDLSSGTFIKLFEYDLPRSLRSPVIFDLYNRLSLLMPTIALPIRLYERREGYSGNTFEATLSGLSVRLDEDRSDNLEEGFPSSAPLNIKGLRMKVAIYAFKPRQSEKYRKTEGVIFTINGQTHGAFGKYFFERQAVGMSYLSDSILVNVDCSEFDHRSREDLFMNSRDRLQQGELCSEIENALADVLKNHKGLRKLRDERRRQEIENRIADSKPLADMLEDMLRKSPTLSKLFIQGLRLPNPFSTTAVTSQQKFIGKKFPSIFKLTDAFNPGHPKHCPINHRFRVEFTTDAVNDYFDRDSDPGSFSLTANGNEIRDYALNLWDGSAYLTVRLPEEAKLGDVIKFETRVSDINRIEPFINEFHVAVKEKTVATKGTPGPRQKPPSNIPGKDRLSTSSLSLPNVIEVHRADWEKYEFNEKSSLLVKDGGEQGYDFYINLDNIHLLTEKKGLTGTDPKLLEEQYKWGMIILGLALLNDAKISESQEKLSENGEEKNNVLKQIPKVATAVSPFLLPMVEYLSDMTEDLEQPAADALN